MEYPFKTLEKSGGETSSQRTDKRREKKKAMTESFFHLSEMLKNSANARLGLLQYSVSRLKITRDHENGAANVGPKVA